MDENIQTRPTEGLEFPGFCKTKKREEICKAYLEFLEGWGGIGKKSFLWGRNGYFMELHIVPFCDIYT